MFVVGEKKRKKRKRKEKRKKKKKEKWGGRVGKQQKPGPPPSISASNNLYTEHKNFMINVLSGPGSGLY